MSDGSIEAESMVRLRESASSVLIGTPSTVRPATDHVPVISGRPPEHWPVTRASSERMPTRSPRWAASAWIAGLRSIEPKPGTVTAGMLGGAGRPGEAGQQRDPQLAEARSAAARWPAGLSAAPSLRVRANSALPVAPPGSPAGGSPPACWVAHCAASWLAVTGSTAGAGPSWPRRTLASQVHGAAAAAAGATSAGSATARSTSSRRRVITPGFYHAARGRTPLSAG